MKFVGIVILMLSQTAFSQSNIWFSRPAVGGGEQTEVWDTVGADNYDAMSDPGDENLIYPTTTYGAVGFYDPGPAISGFLFDSSVPNAATLDSSFLELFSGTLDHVGTQSVSIFAYNVDNAAVFDGTHTHELDAHQTITTDSVVWVLPTGTFETARSPNLAALLQPVINRAGYAQGNRVGIILRMYPEWSGGEYHLFWHHEDAVNTDRWARMKWVYR